MLHFNQLQQRTGTVEAKPLHIEPEEELNFIHHSTTGAMHDRRITVKIPVFVVSKRKLHFMRLQRFCFPAMLCGIKDQPVP